MSNYKIVKSEDGSNTMYSAQYDQHYHSLRDGAINESLFKHIVPAFEHHKDKKELRILDICFGLGYNTFSTIYYAKKEGLNKKLYFYSPELDGELITSLKDFEYPKEFEDIKYIIDEVIENHRYKDEDIEIELFIGNALDYIKTLSNMDIVYQDAFSSDVNSELWTKGYFDDIYKLLNDDGVVTTYSVATPVRLGMHEAGLHIYEYKSENTRRGTLAFKSAQNRDGFVDMDLKKQRNPAAKSL
jgi:tRNA U34 5-methylaminomethyl-2-thiouridine-forming methyltransferase MnmC